MIKNLFLTSIIFLTLFCLYACGDNNSNKSKQEEDHESAELKTIFINGDSINYLDIGNGAPVVFVHGGLGDYRSWGAQMDAFAKNHRVIAYSRRFAYPNKQVINNLADYSVVPHTKDLAEFIKALNLGSVHLVGHSYGASIALLTTIDHPELIRSLTLGEPPVFSLLENVPGGDTLLNNIFTKSFMPAAEAFRNDNDEKAVKVFVGGVMNDSLAYSKIPQQGRNFMMDNTLELRGFVFNKHPTPPTSCDDLKGIRTPVLLVTGGRSPLYITSIIKVLDQCLNNKELATIPNSSHGLQTENPMEFNKIVLSFINEH